MCYRLCIIAMIVDVMWHPSHFKDEYVEDQRGDVTCIALDVAELGSGQQISLIPNLMLVPIRGNVFSLQHLEKSKARLAK